MTGSSQVDQLLQKQQRIQLEIAETETKGENTVAADGRDVTPGSAGGEGDD
jgi:hypothetical protein